MEQKLSDTLVKAIDRSNPMMQNLQLASRFNKLIDEGSSADLEDNHEATITENGIVEITPAEGKDGMKKVTATVNVAGGSDSATVYAWKTGDSYNYLNINTAPNDPADTNDIKSISSDIDNALFIESLIIDGVTYTYVSDTEFTIGFDSKTVTFTRDSAKDLVIWS